MSCSSRANYPGRAARKITLELPQNWPKERVKFGKTASEKTRFRRPFHRREDLVCVACASPRFEVSATGGGAGVTFRLSLSDSGAGRRGESTKGGVPFAVGHRPGDGSYLLLFQRGLYRPRFCLGVVVPHAASGALPRRLIAVRQNRGARIPTRQRPDRSRGVSSRIWSEPNGSGVCGDHRPTSAAAAGTPARIQYHRPVRT